MKNCAYCGTESQPTKEHIWPRNLIEKNEMTHAYNQKTNRLFSGEPVIKDVCAICNNVNLSNLDNYLSSLFENNLRHIVKAGTDASLDYSYDLLLRSLLKISYNASRAASSDKNTKAHFKFAKYILNGGYAPQVMLRLQIVTSSKKVDLDNGDQSDFLPQLLRCGYIPYDGVLHHRFLIKLVAINSYWFYLIIPFKSEPKHKWREMLEGFSHWRIQPGVVIDPTLNTLHIPVDKTTYFDPRLLGSLLHAEFA
jgi:hypothetical protein